MRQLLQIYPDWISKLFFLFLCVFVHVCPFMIILCFLSEFGGLYMSVNATQAQHFFLCFIYLPLQQFIEFETKDVLWISLWLYQ